MRREDWLKPFFVILPLLTNEPGEPQIQKVREVKSCSTSLPYMPQIKYSLSFPVPVGSTPSTSEYKQEQETSYKLIATSFTFFCKK